MTAHIVPFPKVNLLNLPDGYEHHDDLYLTGGAVPIRFPDRLTVHGCLCLQGSPLKELGDNLVVKGNLHITGSSIQKIGKGTKVLGNFYMYNTNVIIPADMEICGEVFGAPKAPGFWQKYVLKQEDILIQKHRNQCYYR